MFRSVRVAIAAALTCLAVFSAMPVTAASSPVAITVKCYSTPEKTTFKNVSTKSVTIKNWGSTYQPYAGEPFGVNKTLAPGQSVTYKTGRVSGAIYGNYIYNDNGRDGVSVVTSAGTFSKHC